MTKFHARREINIHAVSYKGKGMLRNMFPGTGKVVLITLCHSTEPKDGPGTSGNSKAPALPRRRLRA